MIYETDTNRVLIWEGAAWVMVADTDQPPGLQLVTKGTFTSASSASPVDLTSILTTDFPHYKIFIGWTQATSGGWLNMRLRNSGGIISTSTYDNQGFEHYSSTSGATGSLNGSAWNQLAYNYNLGFNSYFTADIMYATVSQPTFLLGRGGTKRTGTGGAYMYVRDTHGYQHDSTVATGLVFYPDGGSMTGRYEIYGYRD